MRKFTEFIVSKRKIFFVIFVALAVAGAVSMNFVKVNYDLSSYLPEDSESKISMEVMYDEFGDNGTLTVMASTLTLKEALAVKEEISGVENVESVLWLDTALGEYLTQYKAIIAMMWPETANMDEAQLLEFMLGLLDSDPDSAEEGAPSIPDAIRPMMEEMVKPFYQDGKALYQVTFTGTAYDESTVTAIDDIKAIGNDMRLGGAAASSYVMQKTLNKELILAAAIIVPLLLILLFSATRSYFEPVVYLIVIGISVLLNMGSNLIIGSISYLTNSIAALIQVAVSMDYSIFLLHSYKCERAGGLSAEESAKAALRKSMSPVSASSLTTIAGFVALMFMRYALGMDIGLVLTKGIVFSLLTAFLFMPGFLVMTDKALMRGEHRMLFEVIAGKPKRTAETAAASVTPQDSEETAVAESQASRCEPRKKSFSDRFAGGLMKLRFVLPILFLALMIPGCYFQGQNDFQYGELASAGGEGSVLMNDRQAIEEVFGSQNNAVVLIERALGEEKELELANKLAELDFIGGVQSYAYLQQTAGTVPSYMDAQFHSENYSRIILVVNTAEESQEAFDAVETIRTLLQEELPDGGYYLMGSSVSTLELKKINNSDYTLSTMLTMIFIFCILLVNMQGLVLPVLLALLIQGSIWINMSIPALAGMPMIYLGYLFVSCFQMGCTVDYGILLSSHYRTNRKTADKFTAAKEAFKASFGPISLSASILALVGFAVGLSGSIPATSNIGLFLGLGTVVSYVAMVFVLPTLLVIFDKPIQWTTLRRRKKALPAEEPASEKDDEN